MCGRTVCSMAQDDVCRACRHRTIGGRTAQPRWRNPPGGQQYVPSYNATPGSHMPVLLSKNHVIPEFKSENTSTSESTSCETLNDDLEESAYVIQPMHWGLIPFWHKGEIKNVGYNMSNARSDGMLTKKSFKGPLERGQRCVVLAEGYYEWQTDKDGNKQPYLIYFPLETAIANSDIELSEKDTSSSKPSRLITMAGIFDKCKYKENEEPVYSYSIITVDSHKSLSWLHHRMPAILKSEKEVQQWLDFGNVPLEEAVTLIRPISDVQTHPVSTFVNKSTNNSAECMKKIDLNKKSASSMFMSSWLGKSQKRKTETIKESNTSPTKMAKIE